MGVVEDLMDKVAEDVTRAMMRTLAICPDPKLPVALAGAAAALGVVTSILDGMAGAKKDGPSPENILLAGLLAARMGIGAEDGIDDELGMAWWNALSERERASWSDNAGNTGRAKDAWESFKASQKPLPNGERGADD